MDQTHDEHPDIEEALKHRSRFFELVGHCITRYQRVEDFLPRAFSAALGGDDAKALAIFATAWGLEQKLNMISAALTGADEKTIAHWSSLRKAVKDAQDARNEIAHGRTVSTGDPIVICMDKNFNVSNIGSTRKTWMELRKRKGEKESVWTLERLLEEARTTEMLFRQLISFCKSLRGEEI